MPMSNADNPAAGPVEAATAEAPEPATKKATKAASAKPEEPVLAKAGHSSDAEVHRLMAEHWTASQNGDAEGMAAANAALAELGYTI